MKNYIMIMTLLASTAAISATQKEENTNTNFVDPLAAPIERINAAITKNRQDIHVMRLPQANLQTLKDTLKGPSNVDLLSEMRELFEKHCSQQPSTNSSCEKLNEALKQLDESRAECAEAMTDLIIRKSL